MRHLKSYQKLPDAMQNREQIFKLLASKKMLTFLDYDGTLTPIASRPHLAVLSEGMRQLLRDLSRITPVAVISGRDKANLKQLVQLPQLFYAGSHGLDIEGPENSDLQYQQGTAFIPLIKTLSAQARQELAGIPGVEIEAKRYTLAIHYRHALQPQIAQVFTFVEQMIKRHPDLHLIAGKKVLEIRPNINWNKGEAMLWIGHQMNPCQIDNYYLYIGDDATDEDAFRLLPEQGIGILVADHGQTTFADYCLTDVAAVADFLKALAHYL